MKRLRIVVGVFILGAIAAGLWFWNSRQPTTDEHELVLYGNVDIRQVQLAFNGSERIVALLVQEGDRVKSGQLLGLLDTNRLAAAVASRGAQVAAQRQVVARFDAGNRPEDIRKAKADLEVAQAEARNAQLTFQRATNLQAQGVLAPQQLDDTTAALSVADSRVNAAKQAYDLMVIGPRKEDIAAAKATLQAYEAELALAQRQLADARLLCAHQRRHPEPHPRTRRYGVAAKIRVRHGAGRSALGAGLRARNRTGQTPTRYKS